MSENPDMGHPLGVGALQKQTPCGNDNKKDGNDNKKDNERLGFGVHVWTVGCDCGQSRVW